MTQTRILPLFGEGGGGGQGIQGPAGPQGMQGTDGAATMQGYQGLQGISGTDGVGIQGLQGFAGIDGSNGLQGLQGYEGASVQGIQGAAGADAVGIQGIQGVAGTDGLQGADGAQGIQGATGTGIQGIQGAAGSGGGSNAWYGTQAQFDALQTLDLDTTYYIQDKLNFSEIEGSIDYSEIANRPISLGQLINSPGYQTKNDVKTLIEKAIDENIPKEKWVTQAEYDLLVANNMLEGGVKYHIEGPQTTLQMVVTFTDETTATYDVYIG